jgi:beta-lactamase superfamily II metal-dependent hydrolase
MLDIKIFNVDRGFCAAIDRHDRHAILIDSGYNSRTGFRPSQYILQQHFSTLDCLIVPAYTEDHLAGIPDLLNQCLEHGLPVNFCVSNPSINSEQFPGLKSANRRLGNALTFTTELHPECEKISQTMTIDEVSLSFFWNNDRDFQELHNLSLVTFLSYRDINMIFPSDLETEGWRALLKCNDFRDRLRRVNIFVASNHGREDGYCPEVFDYCRPELIIISNESHQRISPLMLDRYKSHSKGSSFGVCEKKLLTTYDDGTITISKYLDRLRQVTTQSKASQH